MCVSTRTVHAQLHCGNGRAQIQIMGSLLRPFPLVAFLRITAFISLENFSSVSRMRLYFSTNQFSNLIVCVKRKQIVFFCLNCRYIIAMQFQIGSLKHFRKHLLRILICLCCQFRDSQCSLFTLNSCVTTRNSLVNLLR